MKRDKKNSTLSDRLHTIEMITIRQSESINKIYQYLEILSKNQQKIIDTYPEEDKGEDIDEAKSTGV